MNKTNNKYDLEERTAVFGENIIEFVKLLPDKSEDCRKLWQETQELTMIFAKIIVSSK